MNNHKKEKDPYKDPLNDFLLRDKKEIALLFTFGQIRSICF